MPEFEITIGADARKHRESFVSKCIKETDLVVVPNPDSSAKRLAFQFGISLFEIDANLEREEKTKKAQATHGPKRRRTRPRPMDALNPTQAWIPYALGIILVLIVLAVVVYLLLRKPKVQVSTRSTLKPSV